MCLFVIPQIVGGTYQKGSIDDEGSYLVFVLSSGELCLFL